MRTAKPTQLLGLLVCCLFGSVLQAQSPAVPQVVVDANQARIEMSAEQQSYLLEISGPNGYYFRQDLPDVADIRLAPAQADGTAFEDGSYQVQITPVYRLTEAQQAELLALSQQGDVAGIRAYRESNNLPTEARGMLVNFGVRNGQFVAPTQHEQGLPTPGMAQHRKNYAAPEAIYASLNYFETYLAPTLARDNSMEDDDQVFNDDLIVVGSACVGQDCVNNENFGFDTERLKENNLRIHFDDTSSTGSFPSNDWRITINDSANGGASYFAIEDATAGNIPFRVAAGAGANALVVSSSSGNVGFGTATPVLDLHVASGNTPAMRLEQNGSSGFTSQTWDLAGNEANFFVRDVTNGSKLPFKIVPNAPTNSLVIAATSGNIGLGTQSPDSKLQVESGNVHVKAGNVGINVAPSNAALEVVGNTNVTGNMTVRGDARYFLTTRANFLTSAGANILQIDGANSRVGIGINNPGHLLELGTDDAVKPNGGVWTGASDRRLKTDIRDFKDGLAQVLAIHPVRYHYNGLLDLPTEPEFIGVIAQEIQQVAPYTVRPMNKKGPQGEDYLAYDGSSVTYLLVNAVQEQQAIIEEQAARIQQLEASLSDVAQLRQEVAALAKALQTQSATQTASTTDQRTTEDKR